MRLVLPALTGNYDIIGNISQADCIIGQSFGSQTDQPGAVNELLAAQIDALPRPELPLFLQSEIADALVALQSVKSITEVIRGNPSTSTGGELDSWEVLLRAGVHMREMGLNRPVIMAQAQNMQPVVLAGLPREFDKNSNQPWTRNAKLWALRELAGMAYLRANHKL
jgi:hypothetical protein